MKQRWIVAGAGLALVAGVAAVGVFVAGGDGGTPTPIRLVAGGGTGASTAMADEAMAGPSRMMAPAGPVSFEVPPTLPVLDGPARAWVYRAGRPVTAEQTAAVARALGLEGEPEAVPADQGGGWRVGPADGSAPSLSVSAGAMGDFWYSRPDAYGGVVTCAVPETVGGDAVTDVCREPTPPPGVPDAAGARAIADAFLAAAGQDPDAFEVEVYGDEYSRTVSYVALLDGVRSPLGWYVTVGAEGMIVAAGGQLAQPEPVDGYPRIGTAAALDRLRAGQPAPWLPVPQIAEDAVASGDTGDGGASSDGDVASSDTGTAEVLPEPQPEPLPEPEPQVVQITGVEPSLWFADGADGEVWLLPAYAFLTADGGRWEVAAIDAGLVEVVAAGEPADADEPADAGDATDEPADVTGPGSGVNDSGDGVVVSPDQPAGASIDPNAKPYPMPSPGAAPYPVTPSEPPSGGGQSPSDDG